MKKTALGLLAGSLIFLGGCLPMQKADNSEPLIKINGTVITENKFNKAFEHGYNTSILGAKGVDLKDPQNKFIYLIHKLKVVNDLVVEELIKQEADKRHLKVENSDVNKVIDEISEKMGGKERFEASLALNKVDKKVFEEKIKLDLLKEKLVNNITGDLEISEKEINDFYKEKSESIFKHPKKVRASHILISASKEDIESAIQSENSDLAEEELNKKVEAQLAEAKAKAEKIYTQLKKDPEKFVELAKQYSEDPSSASKGGDLGFFSEDEMVDEFAKAAFSTKPGELSDIVKTQFGYHIIKVVDRKEAGITPLEEVKPHIKRYLEGQKKMDALKTLIETSKQDAKVVYEDESYDPQKIQKELVSIRQKQVEKTSPKKEAEETK